MKNKPTFFQESSTPQIILCKNQIDENIDTFCSILGLNHQQLFYPIKVNGNQAVIALMKNRGINFEVGAISECSQLISQGVSPENIRYGNPVKSADSIREAFRMGISCFGADTLEELEKISKNAPHAKVYIRIAVNNRGAAWTLTHKFGCDLKAVDSLFEFGKRLSLQMFGISFHVGWNNEKLETWQHVFKKVSTLSNQLKQKHPTFNSINIGGGFPAHEGNQIEKLQLISEIISPFLRQWQNKNKFEVVAEPGSYLLANAGTMVVKIIARLVRNNVDWIYVDSGIFQGFSWIMGGLKYKIEAFISKPDEKVKEMVVCGPTCDTHDIYSHTALLPDSIVEGDLLLISPAGAYISSSQSYNGFSIPPEVML